MGAGAKSDYNHRACHTEAVGNPGDNGEEEAKQDQSQGKGLATQILPHEVNEHKEGPRCPGGL